MSSCPKSTVRTRLAGHTGKGPAGHFLTGMKAAAGLPGPVGSPGVRRRQGFRGAQTEGSGGAARGKRCRLGLGLGSEPPGAAPLPRGHPRGGGERGPGPEPLSSGLSGSHHRAGPEAESHFLSPESLDFQRWVASPGRESAPLRASAQDTSTNLARGGRGDLPRPRLPASQPRPGRNQSEGGGAARREQVAVSCGAGFDFRITWTQIVT